MATLHRPPTGLLLDLDNPWPGLESYDEAAHDYFSGRAAEAEELQRRIVDEPTTVLFGKSGLGKTSLLKAGVFPRLREKGLLPIFLRLQIRPGTEPLVEQVRLAFLDELRAQGIEHAEPRRGETLWEYLHRSGQEFWTRQNRLVRPVFVLDQFEELFTLGRAIPAEVAAFREDLADLAENRIPAALTRQMESHPALEQSLDVQTMPYKIVISLREDFLADLEGWRLTMPSLRRNRMRLLPLGTTQAYMAVYNERTKHLVSEPLARTVVSFLASGGSADDEAGDSGATVEPALLSLFCRGVNEHRKRDGKDRFDQALLEGGKETIVADFYRAGLEDQPERVRRFVAEELITEHGFRNSYSVEDALARGFVTAEELRVLINRHLLRQEHHLGTERVELTHDLLTRAVIEERDLRRQAERSERDRQQRRRLLRLASIAGILAVIFALVTVRMVIERNRAQNERANVEAALTVAKTAQERAETATRSAEKAQKAIEGKNVELNTALTSVDEQARIATAQRTRANMESARSRSKELAARALASLNRDPELSLTLALEGMRRFDTVEARSAVLNAAQYVWPSAVLDERAVGGRAEAIALNSDGTRLVVLAGERVVTMWDVIARTPVQAWLIRLEAPASSVAFSPDQSVLAIGGTTSIELRDTASGGLAKRWEHPSVRDRRVVFSPDGRWLAWAELDKLQLLDYRDQAAAPMTIAVKGVGGFAVTAGGRRVIAVTTGPLGLQAFERQGDGPWVRGEVPALSDCMTPQSVSPGAAYFSATWRARACTYEAQGNRRRQHALDRPTIDIVWSPAGHAYAELLTSGDVIVGGDESVWPRHLESHIKGANVHPNEFSRIISASETGARVALIERAAAGDDQTRRVRIYSVADHKPFVTPLPDRLFAIAPDGAWLATVRRSMRGEQASIIDLRSMLFWADDRARVRAEVPLARRPSQLYATPTSVIAVFTGAPVTTAIFDATTGRPRFEPQPGRGQPIGSAGALLLLEAPPGQPWRIIKTLDGSPVAQGPDPAPEAAQFVYMISPRKEALAILSVPRRAAPRATATAVVYSIQGDRMTTAGYVNGLPVSMPSSLQLADDARSIVETRRGSGPATEKFVWAVSRELSPVLVAPVKQAAAGATQASPSGLFELRTESGTDTEARTLKLVKGKDKSIVKQFSGFSIDHCRFSQDERWLVLWNPEAIQVLDLQRGESVLGLGLARVRGAYFEAGNTILKVQFLGDTTMLLPLNRPLTERFTQWLAPRALSATERCEYELGGEECRKEVAVQRALTSPYERPKNGPSNEVPPEDLGP